MIREQSPSEYLLRNCRVITMDGSRPRAEAVGIRSGIITAIGDLEAVRAAHPAGALEYDLGGAVVLPGFIDAHTHVELTTMSRHFWIDVRDLAEPEAVVARMVERSGGKAETEWLVAQGTFGQHLPDKAQLDEAFPNQPAIARWSMHKFVVNQAALDAAGIDAHTTMQPGMRIQFDQQGRLNGVLEEAWDLLPIPSPPKADLSAAILDTLQALFLSNGVTTVHEIGCTPTGVEAIQDLARTREIPRMGVLLTAWPGHQPLTDLTERALSVLGQQVGDDHYWIQGIKIFMDGGRDGAFRSEGLHGPADRWGLLTRLYPTLVRELTTAVEAGLQVCTHAIGDLAQEIAVSAIERVHEMDLELDHRLRVEHFFNESFGTEKLERLVAAGGIAVPNPGFVIAEPDDPSQRQPAGAAKYSLKTLRQIQGLIPGNSDTAGAQPFTTNPWFTMKCMLRLQNKNGVEINPQEVVTVEDALSAFTVDAAYATKQEHVKGRITPGYFADFAVVDKDPFATPTQDFDSIRTLATVVAGRTVFGRLEAATSTEAIQNE